MYERSIITDSNEIELIIPKLSLSGVKLSELKRNKLKPVIGPVYANKLKQYLEHPPYRDCASDIVDFGIKARAYTVVPTVVQFSKYVILMAAFLFIFDNLFKTGFYWQVIPIGIAIPFIYPLLFPWLAGRRFAVKGISFTLLSSLFLLFLYAQGNISFFLAIFYSAFIFGTSIFLALSYTGNSPVSNYSKVKKEIVTFLPLSVFCYVIAMLFYFLSGSYG
jgi:acetyl-CoA decarbonylase/synthase complex subunit gamma